jgi:hypothetical protein
MDPQMEIPRDFKECIELLQSRNVEFVVVGGYALAVSNCPRTMRFNKSL